MSRLEKYAKNRENKGPTVPASTRIPQQLFEEFKTYCEGLGLTVSEGLLLLVKEEMKNVNTRMQNVNIENTNVNGLYTNVNIPYTNVNILQTPIKNEQPAAQRPKRASSSNGERFNTKEFQIGNMIACPLCRKWTSNKNKSRHFRDDHTPSTNTFDVYTNKELAEIARQMVAEKLQNT